MRRAIAASFLILMGMLGSAPARAEESYTFAVVPQFEQRKLFGIWKPIVDELSKRTGMRLNLVATLTVPAFEHELEKGSYDFVYANPYHILRVSESQGYLPLVRDALPLRGILVVRKDDPIRSPAELNGKALAIPSPNALGASLLLRADLEHVYRAKVDMLNVRTHSSVYLNVLTGVAVAGGGVEKTLQEQDKAIQDGLRILYTTREMPSHPIAAHPRVGADKRERVRKALLEMAGTASGAKLLEEVPMRKMVSTTLDDYVVMKKWGLEKYWVQEVK